VRLLGLLLACSLAACGAAEPAPTAAPAPQGPPIDLALTTLDGRPLRLADLRGHVVLLNIWATWCPPCRAEMPDLVRLHEAHGPRGLRVVGVSVDRPGDHGGRDPLPIVREFVRAYGIPFPIAHAPAPDDIGEIEASLGRIDTIPMTFLIGRDGRVVRTYEGARSYRVFEKDLHAVL
jgi:thiol-disulfide isomerase/thioredoxin